MCEPTHFRIDYEINPWMHRSNAVLPDRAHRQWTDLYDLLRSLDVTIDLAEPAHEVPDMTFAANAGIAMGRRFVVANYRYAERQPEAERFIATFEDRGYEIASIDPRLFWEGEGDVLPCGNQVYAGYGFRTMYEALDDLDAMLGVETVRLALVDPRFYHLDTCLFPIAEGVAACYPPAFSAPSLELLRAHFADLIEVPEADAVRFACNAVRVGDTVVMNTGCDTTVGALTSRGYHCAETLTDEFIKAGGSVKCLLLTLDTFGDPSGGRP